MKRLVLATVGAALLVALGPGTQVATATTPGAVPPQAYPHGLSYGQWQARWNQWAYSLPIPDNPGFDETGAKCANGQTGHVWFTSFVSHDGTTTRACSIPSGTALFVLVAALECSNVEPPPFFGNNAAELRECATNGYDDFWGDAVLSMTVDGIAVSNLLSYRSVTPLFSFALPGDNLLGLPAGTVGSGVSDGVYVFLSPMNVGSHTVAIHIGSTAFGTVDEIYQLTVVPRGRY